MYPKVSVITPIYNVEKYLPRCLDSLLAQTLQDIEFICVNDGSTDGSLDILNEYAVRDPRIMVINKPNAGYGHTMNCGLDAACGEYIGIVESDDWVSPDAFETLYSLAVTHGRCDIVKANYFTFADGDLPAFVENYPDELCGRVLSPLDDDGAVVVNSIPAIWSAVYRRAFLEDAGIRFLETPGASFQDTGFVYKAWLAADTFVLTHDAFLNYRVDNAGSSVKSAAKVLNVCEEFASIESFLDAMPERREKLIGRVLAKKFDTYNWNYDRIAWEFRADFLERIASEFAPPFMADELDPAVFKEGEWERLVDILVSPHAVYEADLHAFEVQQRKTPGLQRLAPAAFRRAKVAANRLGFAARRIINPQRSINPTSNAAQPASQAPKVSIIIPVYNAEKYIDKTLDSIQAQTHENLEIICVNDGSTDGSLEKLESRAAHDKRIKVINLPNSGPSIARNAGMEHATGDYLCFIDADDFIVRSAIGQIVGAAESNEAEVVIFGIDEFSDEDRLCLPIDCAINKKKVPTGRVFRPQDVENFFVNVVGFTVNKLYRTDYLQSLELKFPVIGAHEDMPFTYAAMASAHRVFVLDKALYHYRRKRAEGSRSDDVENSNYSFMLAALEYTKSELKRLDIWNEFERDFVNYAAHMCWWKFRLLDAALCHVFYEHLKRDWFSHIGIDNHDDDFFYETRERTFVYNVVDATYADLMEWENECLKDEIRAVHMSKSYKLTRWIAALLRRARSSISIKSRYDAKGR